MAVAAGPSSSFAWPSMCPFSASFHKILKLASCKGSHGKKYGMLKLNDVRVYVGKSGWIIQRSAKSKRGFLVRQSIFSTTSEGQPSFTELDLDTSESELLQVVSKDGSLKSTPSHLTKRTEGKADFLILFFSEALFYCGVAIFVLLVDLVWRPVQQITPRNNYWSKTQNGSCVSSVATLVPSLIIPLVTMGMVWPWTGPAASATLAPYLVGLAVRFAYERHARYQKSPAWPVIPVIKSPDVGSYISGEDGCRNCYLGKCARI